MSRRRPVDVDHRVPVDLKELAELEVHTSAGFAGSLSIESPEVEDSPRFTGGKKDTKFSSKKNNNPGVTKEWF